MTQTAISTSTANRTTPPEPVDPGRHGTREIEITKVEFLDADERATGVAITGERLTIRMHYVAHEPIEEPVFGIGLFTRTGFHINGPNTRFGGQPIPLVQGVGYVDYIVDELPLLAGEYLLSVAVFDSAILHAYDYYERRFLLTVHTETVGGERHGTFLIPSRWEWHEPSSEHSSDDIEINQSTDCRNL